MGSLCPDMDFSPGERALLDASEGSLKRWLQAAQAGEEEPWEHLLCWAYTTARNYYRWKLKSEPWLSTDDSEDLAIDFLLEFERALPGVRSVTHFTHRVLKHKLRRYIRAKKWRADHEAPLEPEALYRTAEAADRPWHNWDDEQWYQYQLTLYMLAESDEKTRKIVARRFGNPARTSRQIAEEMRLSPGAVRMRLARFCERVRRRCRGAP